MYHTGLDVHKKTCRLQQMDDDGALGLSMTVATTPEGLSEFLDRLDGPTTITFEASRGYWWLSQFFASHPKVTQVNVVDPRRSRKLAEELSVQCGYGRAKNDRIDAEMLAEQSRRGLAPTIQLPTPEQLAARTLNRHRLNLVRQHTRAVNRISGLLSMHGISTATATLLKDATWRHQIFPTVPDYVEFVVKALLTQSDLFDQQISHCEQQLEQVLPASDLIIKLLDTHPGFGPVYARIVATEIFDIKHFRSLQHLISYSGLAPVENESAGKQGPVKLNQYCNYYLKYAFIGAAHNARRHPRYQKKYEQDVKKHGKIVAKLNLARRLTKSVYWMLIRQQPYKF